MNPDLREEIREQLERVQVMPLGDIDRELDAILSIISRERKAAVEDFNCPDCGNGPGI